MPAAPSPRPLPGDSHRASAASPRRPGLGPDGTWAGSLRGSGELGQRAKPAPPTASPRDEILAARLAAILSPGQTPRGTAQPRTPRTPRTPRDTGATPLHGPREASYTASSTPRGVPSLRIPLPHADDYDEERDGGDTRPPTSRRATPREQGGATPRHSGTAMTPRTPRTPQTAGGPPQTPRSAGPPQTPREPGAATPRGGPSTARPWEVGEKATARHLWEAKRSLCNPDSVHTLIAATPPRDSATPRGAPLQTCTSDAYGWGDAGGLGADRGGVIRMWRARGELTMQKPLVYKDSDEALRQAGQARVRHAKGKPAPADKPCISLPGKNATSFLREPFEAAEFSDQVLRRLRPQKGEALPSPRVRDLLPGWRKRNLNDGEFCKALVGVPGRPADVGAAHQSLDTLRFQAYHGGPVALNRTKGYAIDPGVVILPGTPRGRKVTDATDYSLEAYETHEGYEPEKPSTAEAKQRHDLLFRKRALRGKPNLGQTLVPRVHSSLVTPTKLIPMEELCLLVPPNSVDARPTWVIETAYERQIIKKVRKKLQAHIAGVEVPAYADPKLREFAGASYLVPMLWTHFIGVVRESDTNNGRVTFKDFCLILERVGITGLPEADFKTLFAIADTDKSGAVDWSEFASVMVTQAATN